MSSMKLEPKDLHSSRQLSKRRLLFFKTNKVTMQRVVSTVYLAKGAICKMMATTICWSVNKPKGAKDGDDNDSESYTKPPLIQ
jgi:hypothetical protein